jgi:nucleoid-associated protein YgaU
MNQRSSAPARVLAAIALLGGALVVAIVVVASLGGGGGTHASGGAGAPAQHRQASRHVPKTYVVQSGDTLTSIAHRTGVPVARIRELNPGLDPQILISGERLKLR